MRRHDEHPEMAGAQAAGGLLMRGLRLLVTALGVAAVGTGFVKLLHAQRPLDADVSRSLLLAVLPLVLFAVLLAHEGGHALGGRLAGFRLAFLVVGPLELRRDARGRLRLRLNRHLRLAAGRMGSISADDGDLRPRILRLTAGGPLASLVLAALGLAGGSLLRGLPGALCGETGLLSLGVALVTLVPVRVGGLASDGVRLRMLLEGGPEADRWCAIAALTAASMAGVRPRDSSAALVARATGLPDGSADDVHGMLLAYAWALDTGAAARAQLHLVRALELLDQLPEFFRSAVALEGAFLAAQHQGDASVARAWLERGRGGLVEGHVRCRAEAAVLLVEGKPSEALVWAEEGLRLVRWSADAGGARLAREWLETLRKRARAQLPDAGGWPPPSAGEGTARA